VWDKKASTLQGGVIQGAGVVLWVANSVKVSAKKPKRAGQPKANDLVNQKKEQPGNGGHDENHNRRYGCFTPRGPDNLGNFTAHLLDELHWVGSGHVCAPVEIGHLTDWPHLRGWRTEFKGLKDWPGSISCKFGLGGDVSGLPAPPAPARL
jgi:hypothetical protein